mmetsp:Transcript_27735/g.66822  ORF Transcript_27735/g.66822 Transcript_27735/m.66822 type:complete len:115 (+) Transcript_27735:414-758(+)
MSALEALKKEGRLRLKKEAVIVDYFSKLPRILSQSRTRENVIHGFEKNGFLDPKMNIMPVLQNIIGSRKKTPTKDEIGLCLKTFFPLMEYSYSHGMRYISPMPRSPAGPRDVTS